jgi:hypothetical protein
MEDDSIKLANCLEIIQNLTYLIRTECTCPHAPAVQRYIDLIDIEISLMSETLTFRTYGQGVDRRIH